MNTHGGMIEGVVCKCVAGREANECDNKEKPGLLVDAHETMTALGGTEKEPKVYLQSYMLRAHETMFSVKSCGKTSLFNIF
jgi:hypothetical protein